MIDKWFKEDVLRILGGKNRIVIIDESAQGRFLLEYIDSDYKIFYPKDEIEELNVKYDIEKNYRDKKVVIYTNILLKDLKFVREYCETDGVIIIKSIPEYAKEKVFQKLNLNMQLDKDVFYTAALCSIGKDESYWLDVNHKGVDGIFNLEKELLPFLHNPKQYISKMDDNIHDVFLKKVYKIINKNYIKKPIETHAKEVAFEVFDGLLYNKINKTLLTIYQGWVDSNTHKPSLKKYIEEYDFPENLDIWQVHPDHPFRIVDEVCVSEISEKLSDLQWIKEKLDFIKARSNSKQAKLLGLTFWTDVKNLIEFDQSSINLIDSISKAVSFYTKHFYKVDTSIRHLYNEFLNNIKIIRPFQDYYSNLNTMFLDKWFRFFNQYEQNQIGLLKKILEENEDNIAIIVGDGISYEIAQSIIKKFGREFKVTNDCVLADLPSDTENNMSKLYISSGNIESSSQKREEYLSDETKKEITYIKLDDANYRTESSNYLICTCKDIDSIGEKIQQNFLKYIDSIEDIIVEKTSQLIKNGFRKVYLVSDHGFVLTGLLSESEKIEVNFTGEIQKSERYIRTENKQNVDDRFIELEQSYGKYNYIYFSKNTKPFKTPGVYGYSHGGATPQEIIIPFVCFQSVLDQSAGLKIKIINKSELENVTGELFQIKIESEQVEVNLFKSERKIYLLFISDGKEVNKSDIITMTPNDSINKEYSFDKHGDLEVIVLDAISKEQLDKAHIKKSSARDIEGLL